MNALATLAQQDRVLGEPELEAVVQLVLALTAMKNLLNFMVTDFLDAS